MAKNKKTCTECINSTTSKFPEKSPETIIKKRGRPKGSKNKKKISTECDNDNKKVSTECKIKRKRGRPRKPKSYEIQEIDTSNLRTLCLTSNLRTLCLIGYCTECHGMITTTDINDATETYKCIRCGHVDKTINLTDYKKPRKKPRSKKAFLKDVLEVHTELEVEKHYIPDEFSDIVENIKIAEKWD